MEWNTHLAMLSRQDTWPSVCSNGAVFKYTGTVNYQLALGGACHLASMSRQSQAKCGYIAFWDALRYTSKQSIKYKYGALLTGQFRMYL